MAKKSINKIIYFDKETIRNILQEIDRGERLDVSDVSSSKQLQVSISVGASVEYKLDIPFLSRLAFLLTGKIDVSYFIRKEYTTTISMTEISEFE